MNKYLAVSIMYRNLFRQFSKVRTWVRTHYEKEEAFALCRHIERWQNQRVLAPALGDALPGARRTLSLPHLLVAYDCLFQLRNEQADSRNLQHLQAFQGLKALVGEKPVVLDRAFSYLELLENLYAPGSIL